MIYLSAADIRTLGIDWRATLAVIAECVRSHAAGQCVQPLKPYLRFKDPANRIIAMPAYVGGSFDVAGIKWIASFPGNPRIGKDRATSVLVLNHADTGEVVSIINTSLLSVIRTASVSALVLDRFVAARPLHRPTIGVIGLGPIGQHHLRMCQALLGDQSPRFVVYDLDRSLAERVGRETGATVVDSWQEAYVDSDIAITCTVSAAPYIRLAPRPGALLLNVSLRDYLPAVFPHVADSIVVDDWDEVCRERTDIERFHQQCGLTRERTRSLAELVLGPCLVNYPPTAPVMFNPMGMAIFDVAIASHYTALATAHQVGLTLPE